MSETTDPEPGPSNRGTEENGSVEVDNSNSVLVKIATLYAEQLMSDINLVVEGKSYPAHRLILCATSEVFQVMLMNREWSEWKKSSIELKETPQCVAVFPNFLRYFYTGQICISHKTVLPVLLLADKYNVKDLAELCVGYMSKHLAQATQQGYLIEWLQYTMACGHDDVAKVCQNFIKWNLTTIAETNSYGNFEPDVLINLLHQNDLVVKNEAFLYEFVLKWLEHQKSSLSNAGLSEEDVKEHMDKLVYATMSLIRYPMMSPRQLAELCLNPLMQSYKEFFLDRMAIGMNFHTGRTEMFKSLCSSEEGKLLFTPRLYTEDKWCSSLVIDNFHSLQCYSTHTLMFSTYSSLGDFSGDRMCNWMVDLYPKGIWFKKALLICWEGSFEIPEVVLRTVRLAITMTSPVPEKHRRNAIWDYNTCCDGEPCMRVKVGVLIYGVQWGVEHIMSVREATYHFSKSQRVLNIDDILDFDKLNTPLYSPAAGQPTGLSSSGVSEPSSSKFSHLNSKKCFNCDKMNNGWFVGATFKSSSLSSASCNCAAMEPSANLIGPYRDQLKVQVIILPLTDMTRAGAFSSRYKV